MHQAACIFSEKQSGAMQVHQASRIFSEPVESKTRTHYGPVGSGRRTAGRRGCAGRGRTGRDMHRTMYNSILRDGQREAHFPFLRAVGTIRPGDNPPPCPPANRRHCPERLFGRTNKLNPFVNRWGNEISG